jgi:hypothetical protein
MSQSPRDESVSHSPLDPAEPVGKVILGQDFLPAPEALVPKPKSAKRQEGKKAQWKKRELNE